MISQTIDERGGRIEVAASMRKLTDHSPVCIKIWGSLDPSQNTPGYFDVSLLSDERRRKDMLEAWIGEDPLPTIDQNWAPWLEAATERTTQRNRRLSKERKRAQGAQIRSCTKKILLAEIQLQTNPTDEEIRGILSDSQSKLTEVFQSSVERNRHLLASNWLRYGDTCSKVFFDFHRAGNKRSLLRELETEGGTVSGQSDLTQYITEFYTRLYSSDTSTPGTEEAKQRCWTSVPTKVSGEINETLTRQLTLSEILTAIKALPKGKAPGNDSLPMEFFHECAEETTPVLLQAFTAMLGNGRASAEINKGVITLIPKSGDRAKLSNWRPITLLGSTYKVLAKVLAGRIKAALTHIIRPNQTGFVEGRSIIDNTFMAQEAFEWAEESEQDLVLLLLDFEKAFDRIEWGFLFTALAKLGFSETWIRWVKTLYLEASSAIKVNGTTGPTFQLARSVRQGCPLAPYLFILATDVLGHMLADPKYKVEGLTLPKGGLVREQTFTDDTALYLQGSPSNLDRAQNVLNIFCQASRARVNWHKSAAIWASKNKREWHWGENVGLKWIPDGEGTRYLEVQVGSHLPPEANFEKMKLSLKNKLISWSNNRLFVAGRILVANQVLLASMWYLTASWNPDPRMCAQIRGIVRNFIWGGRDTLARAKVKWDTMVMPTYRGGLGIIDPRAQSEALLAKLLTRGLAPGGEP
jgi:mannosylglycoprotein endo-beta-mannosidase